MRLTRRAKEIFFCLIVFRFVFLRAGSFYVMTKQFTGDSQKIEFCDGLKVIVFFFVVMFSNALYKPH